MCHLMKISALSLTLEMGLFLPTVPIGKGAQFFCPDDSADPESDISDFINMAVVFACHLFFKILKGKGKEELKITGSPFQTSEFWSFPVCHVFLGKSMDI